MKPVGHRLLAVAKARRFCFLSLHHHAGFFAQFGNVTKVRVSRNKKTGRAKHYAFLEFQYADVAATAAEAMDGYMLFTQKLVVRVVPVKVLYSDMPDPTCNACSASPKHVQQVQESAPGTSDQRYAGHGGLVCMEDFAPSSDTSAAFACVSGVSRAVGERLRGRDVRRRMCTLTCGRAPTGSLTRCLGARSRLSATTQSAPRSSRSGATPVLASFNPCAVMCLSSAF